MKTEDIKAAVMLTGIAFLGIAAFKVYSVAKSSGESFRDSISNVVNTADENITKAQEYIAQKANDFTASISGAVDSVSGNVTTSSSGYVKEVGSNRWDAGTKKMIQGMNLVHGRKALDYSGWHVYTDGTVITPAGEYLKPEDTSTAMQAADGWAGKLAYSPTGGDGFDLGYPNAANFLEEGFKNTPVTSNGYFTAF